MRVDDDLRLRVGGRRVSVSLPSIQTSYSVAVRVLGLPESLGLMLCLIKNILGRYNRTLNVLIAREKRWALGKRQLLLCRRNRDEGEEKERRGGEVPKSD